MAAWTEPLELHAAPHTCPFDTKRRESRSAFIRSISASALSFCRTANVSYTALPGTAAGEGDTAALLGTADTPAVAITERERCTAAVGVAFTIARIGVALAV